MATTSNEASPDVERNPTALNPGLKSTAPNHRALAFDLSSMLIRDLACGFLVGDLVVATSQYLLLILLIVPVIVLVIQLVYTYFYYEAIGVDDEQSKTYTQYDRWTKIVGGWNLLLDIVILGFAVALLGVLLTRTKS